MEQRILEWINSVYNFMGWPGVVILMAAETVFTPIPSEIIMPLAGWMLIKERGLSVIYIMLAGFYGALGSTIGSVIIYGIAFWGGRPLVERYGKYVFISRHDIDRAEQWFAKHGRWVVCLSHLIPQVRSFISIPAGVVRMRFLTFLLYTLLGAFVWCVFLAYGGYLLGENYEQISDAMRPFVIPIIAVIGLVIIIYIWRRVRKRKQES